MKKHLLFAASALLMLASCSSESVDFTQADVASQQNDAIEFGTYLSKTGTTRAGTVGAISSEQVLAQKGGFGVFAFYTNASEYSASATPNFMWNQAVLGTDVADPVWTYTPIKYWPNETASGVVDQNAASSTGGPDKLSFFAYAPYTATTTTAGTFTPAETANITALTGNTTAGDPKVSFVLPTVPTNDATVDLLWGVSPGTSYTIAQSSTAQSTTAGLPNLNLTKQTVGEKIDFNFRHALAKVTFNVEGVFDEVSAGSKEVASGTKIVVEKVDITSTFPEKGILNLNNTAANVPLWDISGATGNQTINTANSLLTSTIKFNSGTDTYAGQPAGVTTTATALLADSKYFMLIPATKNMTITITYHVFTADTNLNGGFSKVTNVITKTISDLALVGGNAYTINMYLGMTSVNIDASFTDWGTGSTTSVDLPINVQ